MHQMTTPPSPSETTEKRVVVLSNLSEPECLLRNDVVHIGRQGATLISGERHIDLPAEAFDLGSAILDGQMAQWEPVLEWLAQDLGPSGILIFPFDDPFRDLGLLARARNMFRYGLYFAKAPRSVAVRDYPVFGSAEILIFKDSEVKNDVRRAYVPWYNGILADCTPSQLHAALNRHDAGQPPQVSTPQASTGPRILLIAYFSGPARTVGVQRINYWHRKIPEFWPGASVTVATATPWKHSDSTVLRIPDLGPGCLVRKDGTLPAWAPAFLESKRRDAKSVATLSQCWRIGLENHFDQTDDQFDLVIISGNPFSVFDFSAYAKRRWSARVVLDYRDPFSNNPRMGYKPEARKWARYLEKGYNLQADLVTVVNEDCAAMVEGREDVPVAVIANGFDESALPDPLPRWSESDGKVHFIHTGTIYPGRSPGALIEELAKAEFRFHHVGNPALLDVAHVAPGVVEAYGRRPYEETLQLISRANCGVVFVHSNGFDTPTKLFDYMAYGIDILILTDGEFGAGAAGELVRGIERVYWAKNTAEGIADFLSNYSPSSEARPEAVTAEFSRRFSTTKMIRAMKHLL